MSNQYGGFGGFGGFGGGFGGGYGQPPGAQAQYNWGGMSQASADEGGAVFGLGSFVVEIQRCVLKNSRKGALLFIAECLIHQSSNPENPVGTTASWFQKMHEGQYRSTSLSAVKGFVQACLGLDSRNDAEFLGSLTDQAWSAFMARVYGVENVLAGAVVNLTTVNKPTQSGQPFTQHNWRIADNGPTFDVQALFAGAPVAAPAPQHGAPPAPPAPPAPVAAPPPPPAPAAPPAQISPCGNWRLDTATNAWVPNR